MKQIPFHQIFAPFFLGPRFRSLVVWGGWHWRVHHGWWSWWSWWSWTGGGLWGVSCGVGFCVKWIDNGQGGEANEPMMNNKSNNNIIWLVDILANVPSPTCGDCLPRLFFLLPEIFGSLASFAMERWGISMYFIEAEFVANWWLEDERFLLGSSNFSGGEIC